MIQSINKVYFLQEILFKLQQIQVQDFKVVQQLITDQIRQSKGMEYQIFSQKQAESNSPKQSDQEKETTFSKQKSTNISEQQKYIKQLKVKFEPENIYYLESPKRTRQKIQWSSQEDNLLFEKIVQIGSRWIQMSQFFPKKNDNALKNRFYCCIKKVQRLINKIQKQRKIMAKRLISYQTLLTIIQIGKFRDNGFDKRFQEINKLGNQILLTRNCLINLAKKQQHEIEKEEIVELTYKVLTMKHSLKFINMERVKKSASKEYIQKKAKIVDYPTSQTIKIQADPIQSWSQVFQEHSKHPQLEINCSIQQLEKHYRSNQRQDIKISLMQECPQVLSCHPKQQPFDDLIFL